MLWTALYRNRGLTSVFRRFLHFVATTATRPFYFCHYMSCSVLTERVITGEEWYKIFKHWRWPRAATKMYHLFRETLEADHCQICISWQGHKYHCKQCCQLWEGIFTSIFKKQNKMPAGTSARLDLAANSRWKTPANVIIIENGVGGFRVMCERER